MLLITAQQVLEYTEFEAVKKRAPEKIESDILQAQIEVFAKVGHRFTDPKYDPLPKEIVLALIKLAEYYALINSDESIQKGYASETLENYSYTLANGGSVCKPSIDLLLSGYVESASVRRPVNFRMQAL